MEKKQLLNTRAQNPRPASQEQMEWFLNAKFGLFIHWGPASISGEEISWGRMDRIEGGEAHQKVPGEIYDNLYKEFNPTTLGRHKGRFCDGINSTCMVIHT